jgi:serine/threonine protein kinase
VNGDQNGSTSRGGSGTPEILNTLEGPPPTQRPEYATDEDPPTPALGSTEPARLGSFPILRLLGQGGMGLVYEAEDPKLKRRVAIKVMRRELARNEQARQRFLREAKAVAALDHEHIVAVYQADEDQGVPFLVMPLLKGETLAQRLQRQGNQPLPLEDVLRLGREMALGLAAAHAKGLIHRDIKPSNVWLEAGSDRVKLLDFGLARAANRDFWTTQDDILTVHGQQLGTPSWMSPEQVLASDDLDHRCDLFSLGVVLYQMATGELPFTGKTVYEIQHSIASREPKPPEKVNRDLPPALVQLIKQLLEKEPRKRPASAVAVARELEAIEKARLEPPPQGPTGGRSFPYAALWVAGILAVVALVVWLVRSPNPTTRTEPEKPLVSWKPPKDWEPADPVEFVVDPLNNERFYKRLVRKVGPQGIEVFVVAVPRTVPGDPDTFYIMENKVWNDLYEAFINDPESDRLFKKYSTGQGREVLFDPNARTAKAQWRRGAVVEKEKESDVGVGPNKGRLPVFRVTVMEAHCFALWLKGLLPTRKQWYKAAGWTKGEPRTAPPTDRAGLAIGRAETGPWTIDQGDLDVGIHGCRQMASNGEEYTRDLSKPIDEILLSGAKGTESVYYLGRSYAAQQVLTLENMYECRGRCRCTEASPERTFRIVLER